MNIWKLIATPYVYWLKFLSGYQQSKPLTQCARPGCTQPWHDHVFDVRLCRKHHPKYRTGLFASFQRKEEP